MGEAAKRTSGVRDGFRAALPLVPGPVLFGLSFGVLAEGAGMGVAAAPLAIWKGVPIVAAMAIAAGVTALLRLFA